jgi:hypothetical protein
MKVSKDIQNKMHRAARLFSQAQEIMKEVDNYFEKKGIDVEELRSGDGISLEELEYGTDITDQFVEWFEENY